MVHSLRQSTLETLGLGTVLDIFARGELPVSTGDLVDEVFGPPGKRGALVISGGNGIVGAGKAMQLGSRLEPYDIPIVALDLPGGPDGLKQQLSRLSGAFGRDKAAQIAGNIVQMSYDGASLPARLADFRPRFLLEAIPEILELKKAHYDVFRTSFPDIAIRSVTSGFPMKELGVPIAHPAFPHEINKLWEIVEDEPSAITKLLWALGLVPMPVGDQWSFVLDVLFCGVTQAALRYHEASNMPFWKIDKYVRADVGPNPFRAHDAIGAKGANFLTWSCLHHLGERYGAVFEPSRVMTERMETGQSWYPLNHFRPLVDWKLDEEGRAELNAWVLGALLQMTSLLVAEERAHFTHMNLIGELCAQLRSGVLAVARDLGPEKTIWTVEAYHELHPEAKAKAWHPEVFEKIGTPEWQQLYVNAEHDGQVGVISIARESYNWDVDAELNRAIDWLKAEGIDRVILSGDFHLATQLVGADVSEFFAAFADANKGVEIPLAFSGTARRLNDEFAVSVGFINGKRCLGGFLELMVHCHYVVAVEGTQLGFPEVGLPVVPGMEGCHWPFRKTGPDGWPKLLSLLLEGRFAKAETTTGWLIDYAGALPDALSRAWELARGGDHGMKKRPLAETGLEGVLAETPALSDAGSPGVEAGRTAILDTVAQACGGTLAEALEVQARLSGEFMASAACRKGTIGATHEKIMV